MKKILWLILVSALLLSACGTNPNTVTVVKSQKAAGTVTTIRAEEAYERIKDSDRAVVVDVRTPEEYEAEHIPGAVLIPSEEIGTTPPPGLPVMDAEILVYCRSGNRSAKAAGKLADMGYTHVYDFGGIQDWNYETEQGEYKESEKAGTLNSFTAFDVYGVKRDESIFADYALTMINIWATFCNPCLKEMPELSELAKEYRDKGVQVIGIVADVMPGANGAYETEAMESIQNILTQTGADYMQLLPGDDLIKAKLQSVSAVPETVFVDREGNLVGESYLGARSKADWEEILDSRLEKVQK